MKTNDVILFGVGVLAGYFIKFNLDKRNAITSTNNIGAQMLPDDTNYVFSQNYKDCEDDFNKIAFKLQAGTDMGALKKQFIDKCISDKLGAKIK
jgi:hypothetical protein